MSRELKNLNDFIVNSTEEYVKSYRVKSTSSEEISKESDEDFPVGNLDLDKIYTPTNPYMYIPSPIPPSAGFKKRCTVSHVHPIISCYLHDLGELNEEPKEFPEMDIINGIKIWTSEGKLHNINKPSIIYPDGTSKYYFKGLLHNSHGPAVSYPNGEVEYWIDGMNITNMTKTLFNALIPRWRRSRSELDIEVTQANTISRTGEQPASIRGLSRGLAIKIFARNGYIHRDDNEPSVISHDHGYEYYYQGLVHNDNGPAIVRTDGTQIWCNKGIITKIQKKIEEIKCTYNQDNKLHSFNDQPAYVQESIGLRIWYSHGLVHRYVKHMQNNITYDVQLPAVELDNMYRMYYRNGLLHRDQGAAIEYDNADKSILSASIFGGDKTFYHRGCLHRSGDAPALELADETVVWFKNGLVDSFCDKPAIRTADGCFLWFIKHQLGRLDNLLPSVVLTDGTIMWYVNNKRHREELPAVIRYNATREWWFDDEIHRQNIEQPSIMRANIGVSYYIRGVIMKIVKIGLPDVLFCKGLQLTDGSLISINEAPKSN